MGKSHTAFNIVKLCLVIDGFSNSVLEVADVGAMTRVDGYNLHVWKDKAEVGYYSVFCQILIQLLLYASSDTFIKYCHASIYSLHKRWAEGQTYP